MLNRRLVALAASVALFTSQAHAGNIPFITGPWDPGDALGTLNSWIQNSLNPNTGSRASSTYAPKNLLDNGAMNINQRAVTATCATTSGIIETSYSMDRWACDVNMATGAGQLARVTSSPTPPTGFSGSATLVRNSGALDQPVCAWQEMPTSQIQGAVGKNVILSANVQALANLNADNGNTFFMGVMTGTGTNEGLGGLQSAVGMNTTVKNSSFTISTSTGTITNASTVVAGQPITITAAAMPTGITSGKIYYVSSAGLNSGTSFRIAATYTDAINGTNTVVPSTGGTTNVLNLWRISPAWTGVAVYGSNGSGMNQTSSVQALGQIIANSTMTLPASGSWGAFNTGPIFLPTGVNEAAVFICFTPNSSSSGSASDGIAFTGVQLEVADANVTTPSSFQFVSTADEIARALRYAWIVPEPAASLPWGNFTGTYSSATTCELHGNTPVPMFVAPIVSFTGTALANTTGAIIANSATPIALATPFLAQSTIAATNTQYDVALLATTASKTAGFGCLLVGAGGGAVLNIGADF